MFVYEQSGSGFEPSYSHLNHVFCLGGGGNVNHYQSIHHPLSTLPTEIGNTSKQISKFIFFLVKLNGGERSLRMGQA